MKLWFISQTKNVSYDTFDSAVVAAESEAAARLTHPCTYDHAQQWTAGDTWCESPDDVTAELIGEAVDGTEAGVICASFNAG